MRRGRKVVDETGNRHGRLTVVRRAGKNKQGKVTWLCKCDCGNEKVVRGDSLRDGRTRSCGCLRGDHINGPRFLRRGMAAFNTLCASMKIVARKRNLEWQLTREQVYHLTKQPCHYCGAEPSQTKSGKGYNGVYVYNGIDRVDNSKGYTTDNVVPCCKHCNYAKRAMTLNEFRSWAIRLCEHFSHNSLS